MIVAMQETATEEQIQVVIEHLMHMGFSVHRTTGERQSILAAVGARADFDTRNLEVLGGVEHVHRISAPYDLDGILRPSDNRRAPKHPRGSRGARGFRHAQPGSTWRS